MEIQWGRFKENRFSSQAPPSRLRLLIGGTDRIVFFSWGRLQIRIMNPLPWQFPINLEIF